MEFSTAVLLLIIPYLILNQNYFYKNYNMFQVVLLLVVMGSAGPVEEQCVWAATWLPVCSSNSELDSIRSSQTIAIFLNTHWS